MVKNLKKNKFASGAGGLLLLIPFIISLLLTMAYQPMGETTGINNILLTQPEHYEEMTQIEREKHLENLFGGHPEKEFHWGFKLSFPDFAGRWYIVYPDGTEIELDDWEKFIEGYGVEPDYYNVVMSIIAIDPPILATIGIWGAIIRVLLIVSVCIGLVDLVWIG